MTTGSWEDVIQRIEEFRRAVEGRADGRGGSLADLKRHRDRILEAIRALPDRRERIAIAALQGLLAADPALDLPYEQSAMMAVRQADALIVQLDEGQPYRSTVHTVQPGETLSDIALRYYGRPLWPELAKVNRLSGLDHLERGWILAIPKDLP